MRASAPAPSWQSFPELREEQVALHVDGEVIGFANAIDCEDEVWIAEIAVHPGYQGRGLGTLLLASVLARYSGRDVALSCDPFAPSGNGWPPSTGLPVEALAAWYSRHGFRAGAEQRMLRTAAAIDRKGVRTPSDDG
ncbi:GNAT family N-acetyltransferase [Kitasatospora sp. NPDC088548]|uniref:GNAT family N-acetyltransferase n=1 Tax=Kitasatospora sp. NPDC088548 TaxID=3364075 RepID=UPI003822A341